MVTATPHEDLEMFFEAQRQIADETQARAGHLHPKFGGPLADGWQLTVGNGHSGLGIYAHMTEYPEEGSIFWRTLNDVQNEAYAEGRKDEAEEHAWRPIETAPEDENILVATVGGHVDTAFWTDDDGEGRKWWWLESANKYAPHPIHPDLVPTHWMPLPKHPAAA